MRFVILKNRLSIVGRESLWLESVSLTDNTSDLREDVQKRVCS